MDSIANQPLEVESFTRPGTITSGKSLLAYLHEWIVTVDHKKLGIMYILYALLFLVVGGVEAMVIRLQLAVPNNHLVGPQTFNQLFTMHGTTMIFLAAMPFVFGFANYLVPLMIGARDMAFPRLNAFGFWLTAFGGLLLYFSLIGGEGMTGAGSAPDVGWFAYSPLPSKAFSKGHSTDYWTLGILIGGFGSIATAINILTTILCLRCRGMTLMRMPLLAWLYLVVAGMVLIAISPLSAAQIMLLLDRFLGAHFFDTQAGGSAVLWMHFFWIFGHPEVYILVLPVFAFASEIIPVFSGMTSMGNTFFAISTMLVGVPTGIKIFNWIGTMWGGKIRFASPMLFSIGFLAQFLIAGLTGIMLAAAPFDWQLTDSYFVIAHFHYVIVGAIVFMIFAATYYWFPKATGRLLDETLGKWHFWLFLIGFHLTFDTMHIPGILGMPRRIYTYAADRGWGALNLVCTVGAVFQALGLLVFVFNIIRSLRKGQPAGNDPWDAWTLEWATSSPPPEYNFAETPVVRSRRPLWDLKHPTDPDWKYE